MFIKAVTFIQSLLTSLPNNMQSTHHKAKENWPMLQRAMDCCQRTHEQRNTFIYYVKSRLSSQLHDILTFLIDGNLRLMQMHFGMKHPV